MNLDNPMGVPLRFFSLLQEKKYLKAWQLMTEASQQFFVQSLVKSLNHPSYDAAKVRSQLENPDSEFFKSYWPVFSTGLELSRWLNQTYSSQLVREEVAFIRAKPSGILLQVFRESYQWKFGYIETFLEPQA